MVNMVLREQLRTCDHLHLLNLNMQLKESRVTLKNAFS